MIWLLHSSCSLIMTILVSSGSLLSFLVSSALRVLAHLLLLLVSDDCVSSVALDSRALLLLMLFLVLWLLGLWHSFAYTTSRTSTLASRRISAFTSRRISATSSGVSSLVASALSLIVVNCKVVNCKVVNLSLGLSTNWLSCRLVASKVSSSPVRET